MMATPLVMIPWIGDDDCYNDDDYSNDECSDDDDTSFLQEKGCNLYVGLSMSYQES